MYPVHGGRGFMAVHSDSALWLIICVCLRFLLHIYLTDWKSGIRRVTGKVGIKRLMARYLFFAASALCGI